MLVLTESYFSSFLILPPRPPVFLPLFSLHPQITIHNTQYTPHRTPSYHNPEKTNSPHTDQTCQTAPTASPSPVHTKISVLTRYVYVLVCLRLSPNANPNPKTVVPFAHIRYQCLPKTAQAAHADSTKDVLPTSAYTDPALIHTGIYPRPHHAR